MRLSPVKPQCTVASGLPRFLPHLARALTLRKSLGFSTSCVQFALVNFPIRTFFAAIAGCLFSILVQAQEPSAVFKVGAARRDITPKEAVPMWGYGARHDALSTGML